MALEYVIWTLTRLTTSKVITKLPSYHFVKWNMQLECYLQFSWPLARCNGVIALTDWQVHWR